MIYILFGLLAIFTSGCGPCRLKVLNEYMPREYLASFNVKTPDPLEQDPPLGQRLIVYWALGSSFCNYKNVYLSVRIRLKNRELREFSIPVNSAYGQYIFEIIREEYFCTRGILTYDIVLVGDGEVIDEWKHALWEELIIFDIDD